MIDRLLGHDEALGDLCVPKPLGEERHDLKLPCGQTGGILARCWSWPTGDAAHASFAQATSRDCSGGPGTKPHELIDRLAHGLFVLTFCQCQRRLV